MLSKVSHFYWNKYVVSPFAQRRYALSYDFQHKALWFRVYKVASRTIDKHFRENTADGQYIYSSDVGYNPSRYADYFKFAFVRRPVERFVSAWMNKHVNENFFGFDEDRHNELCDLGAFVSWVETLDVNTFACDEHLRAQHANIDLSNIDFLGRFEHFDDDFDHVCSVIGIPHQKKLHLNKTKSSEQEVSLDLQRRIADIYHRDIRLFYPDMIPLLTTSTQH